MLQVTLYRRRSQELLDPFGFVESLVGAKTDIRREFQVNAMRNLVRKKRLCRSSAASTGSMSRPPIGIT